jgi:hypothetical protein
MLRQNKLVRLLMKSIFENETLVINSQLVSKLIQGNTS